MHLRSHRKSAVRRGISLLEVLISIGILTVGLLATFSLIPAGRTYLTKAAVDDRAAALISNAYNTLTTLGLMKKDALGWVDDSGNFSEEAGESKTSRPWRNNSSSAAFDIPSGSFETTYVKGRVRLVRSVIRNVSSFRGVEHDVNADTYDVDEEDWYRLPVQAGQTVALTGTPGFLYEVYLNGAGRRLNASKTVGTQQIYSIPVDGFVFIRVFGSPPENPPGVHANGFVVEITRPDRMIVVDPLMTTRLDWLVAQSGIAPQDLARLDLRRRFFADFNQQTGSGEPRTVRVPRLNWQWLTSPTSEQAVAIADRYCRSQDDLEVDDKVLAASGSGKRDEFAPPRPRYATQDDGSLLARQTLGRMSWAIGLQPQASGSVADNWRAGAIFDVSIVVFQDRVLAPLSWQKKPVVNGEYTLPAWWNETQGVLTVDIPQPYVMNGEEIYLDDEDIRAFFRTGGWALLAPRVAYDSSPIDDRQKFTWVQFQAVELAKSAGGVTVNAVPLLEPPAETLLGTPDGLGRIPLVAVVNEGVVAVVTKQMMVE